MTSELSNNEPDMAPGRPASVLCFNASDPSGAQGITGDVLVMASVGAHPSPVVTGAWVRDTSGTHDLFIFDTEAIEEQARAALEDLSVRAIKVGFAGSAEAVATIAELASEYADRPLIAYMPDLSWWEHAQIEAYHDAFAALLLPLASVLVGHHSTLRRWLLPEWADEQPASARDIAAAAARHGTAYTLVTGISQPGDRIDNVLASANAVLGHEAFERIEARFAGAGETLSACLTALVALGQDLNAAASEALHYLDRSLAAGFRPGMGHALPDRLFWAQPDDEEDAGASPDEAADTDTPGMAPDILDFPFNDTQH